MLEVNGILYVSTPDNAWALDARDGHELWHYFWKTRGGTHIGNRGLGMYGNWLFMETPDDYLVSLDARTGKERWHKVIASFEQQYFSTAAPIIVGNHVLVGTGDDLDEPGVLQAFDPETGDVQWKFYAMPMKAKAIRRWLRGRIWMRRSTAEGRCGCRDPTIRRRITTSSGPAIRRPRTPRPAAARATIFTPVPSWRSTSIPARSRGITRPRRTTRTIGIARRRRCWWTERSTASLARWC